MFTLKAKGLLHASLVQDGMLVRVSSVDPDPRRAYAQQARFADDLVRAIAPRDRNKVIGIPPQG